MSDALLNLAYLAITVVAARRVYWALRDDGLDDDSVIEKGGVGVLSLLAGAFWPLALPVMLVMMKPRPTRREVEAERLRLQRRIAELEQQNAVTP